MKLYFIRHAPTLANLSGSMVPNYDQTEIIQPMQSDLDSWQERVGSHIDYTNSHIFVSHTLRARQTAELFLSGGTSFEVNKALFAPPMISTCDNLAEFDCHGLGDKKFWEITKEEFEQLVPITTKTMRKQAGLLDVQLRQSGYKNCICVSHGMLIRYMFHYYTGRENVHPYDIINSKDFKFSHLDMMVLDTDRHYMQVYRFKEPIDHKESK